MKAALSMAFNPWPLIIDFRFLLSFRKLLGIKGLYEVLCSAIKNQIKPGFYTEVLKSLGPETHSKECEDCPLRQG